MSVVQMAPPASLEIENRWDDAHAAKLSPAELLLYRSNLLGSRQAHHQLRRRQHLGQDHARRTR